MPYKQPRPCRSPFCPRLTHSSSGYCEVHAAQAASVRGIDRRLSASKRGYDSEWREVRAEVLTSSGIPRRLWHLYDVDHNPPYDPSRESDHRKYMLIPRLHREHSAKTAREDGGWGRKKKDRGGGAQSLGPPGHNRTGEANFFACKIIRGGV